MKRYFTITKDNSIPDFISGKFKVYLPQEFVSGEGYPKRIDVLNFIYFNNVGQIDLGISCHSDFNTDAVENDQMICFCTYGSILQKSFEIRRNITHFNLWFKDYKNVTIFPVASEEYFILELNLIF